MFNTIKLVIYTIGIGIIVFSIMGYFLFKEPITLKTGISILLAIGIIFIQLKMK
jgi:multidrug transporter EmrE-like cation transporter